MFEKLGLFPPSAATHAAKVDALYLFLIGLSGFFALLIATMIIVFAIRFRRRSESHRPAPIEGSLALELTWTLIPFCLTMVIFFWSARVFVGLRTPPRNAVEMFVVGKQWMWKVQHLEGRREINELHVPTGQPIKLILTSEDVIHSFYVPAFRIKQDAVPGRYTDEWFEATTPGTYHLFCAEFCGTWHSRMIGQIVVMDPADYQAWLSGRGAGVAGSAQGGSVADSGAALFASLGCATCHRGESGDLGPALGGIVGTKVRLQSGESVEVDDAYLRESILNPQAKIVAGFQPVMPTFKGQVSEEDLLQLITYIKTLRAAPGAGGAHRES